MHGRLDQIERERAFNSFKSSRVPILIATDVVGRGIDIDDITYVFNYDMPPEKDNYVHRVGRTGRAGRTGYAKTLFNPKDGRDRNQAHSLRTILEQSNQAVPTWLKKLADRVKNQQEMEDELGIKKRQRGKFRT